MNHFQAGQKKAPGPPENSLRSLTCRDCIRRKVHRFVLEKGGQRVGRWVEESVNILDDYRRAFGKDPPPTAGLAVMSDTDNAGGSAAAYIDFIEVYRYIWMIRGIIRSGFE